MQSLHTVRLIAVAKTVVKEWLLNQFDSPEQNSKCEHPYECPDILTRKL